MNTYRLPGRAPEPVDIWLVPQAPAFRMCEKCLSSTDAPACPYCPAPMVAHYNPGVVWGWFLSAKRFLAGETGCTRP